ncbi:hypothetical protein [Paraburkholderia sp. J7]|nr:hypothetical protein [Paraburkholderia sp. J7]
MLTLFMALLVGLWRAWMVDHATLAFARAHAPLIKTRGGGGIHLPMKRP